MRRRLLGLAPQDVRPLNTAQALDVATSVMGEVILFGIAGAAVYWEWARYACLACARPLGARTPAGAWPALTRSARCGRAYPHIAIPVPGGGDRQRDKEQARAAEIDHRFSLVQADLAALQTQLATALRSTAPKPASGLEPSGDSADAALASERSSLGGLVAYSTPAVARRESDPSPPPPPASAAAPGPQWTAPPDRTSADVGGRWSFLRRWAPAHPHDGWPS